jgi:lipid-binding SYLF domain-containing protein
MFTVAAAATALSMVAATTRAAELSSDERDRIRNSATVLREIHAVPDKDIPNELWEKAECVVVIPSLKKAAFIVGGEYGRGLMSCRKGNGWSAPVFMELEKGSWGFQLGAQSIDLVLLVMNRGGMEKMLSDKVSLGAEASVAAGPVGRDARAATDAQLKAEVLSYSRAQGLFAGIDLSGGVLKPDDHANGNLYGANASARDIVLGNVAKTIPAAAAAFTNALERRPVATTGEKK